MRFTILILSLLAVHGISANLFFNEPTLLDVTKGYISSVADMFTHSYNKASDLFSTEMDDLRSKVDNTVSYLGNAYENRETIVKKGGKKVDTQLDKLRPAYDEVLAFKNKLSHASADQYDRLSEEWRATISKLDSHGFDDYVDMTKEHSMPIIAVLAAALCVVTVAIYARN